MLVWIAVIYSCTKDAIFLFSVYITINSLEPVNRITYVGAHLFITAEKEADLEKSSLTRHWNNLENIRNKGFMLDKITFGILHKKPETTFFSVIKYIYQRMASN